VVSEKGRISWLWGCVAEDAQLLAARKQRREDRTGREDIFPGHTPNDLLPPARPYLPKMPLCYESIK
jgi:hypothetical protein